MKKQSAVAATSPGEPVDVVPFPTSPNVPDDVPLSTEEQQGLWAWLFKGATLAAACQQQGISVKRFWYTLVHDPQFSAALQELFDTLSQNVVGALYQAAMKGNITAQQFWLRHRRPAQWSAPESVPASDELDQLADDQLLDELEAAIAALPPEIAARLAPPTE